MFSSALFVLGAVLGAAPPVAAPTPTATTARTVPARETSALPTREEALSRLCPGATWKQQTHYPSAAELERATQLCGEKVESKVLVRHSAYVDGKLVLSVFFDTHRVRSLGETLMVAITPDGRLRRIEVLAFAEPRDYLPRAAFYSQFDGRALDSELRLDRGVRGVAGATLTSRATVSAARRVLALHSVLPAAP